MYFWSNWVELVMSKGYPRERYHSVGILDIYDAVALLRYSVGLDSGENLQLIDLNGDGLVNCADASTVLRWLVGLSA